MYVLSKPTSELDPVGLFSWPKSYGSFAEVSVELGPIGASLVLDIDIPASEFKLSLNLLGSLTPSEAVDIFMNNYRNIKFKPSGKIVGGFYGGSAGETSLGGSAFYGQGLIAGGSVSRGTEGNELRLYAGAGGGNPISVGGSQQIWQGRMSGENFTFQRAIGTAMPFIPIARWAIFKAASPQTNWLDAWNLANPAFGGGSPSL